MQENFRAIVLKKILAREQSNKEDKKDITYWPASLKKPGFHIVVSVVPVVRLGNYY